MLVRRVARVVVCDPRRNKLLKSGNKGDLLDARKLYAPCQASMTHSNR